MRTALTLAIAVLALILFGAVSSVRAADLVGGTLSAGGHEAIVTSHATMPVLVTVAGEAVSADPATFTLEPGASRHVTLTGTTDAGMLSALLQAVPVPGADSASVTLTVNLGMARVPATFPWGIAWALLALAGLALLAVRLRPWQFRISRKEGI
jgi:hypothetical protein